MKSLAKFTLGLFFALSMALPNPAKAGVQITDFTLGESTVSFAIDGTLPLDAPADVKFVLYFTNPDQFANPGFVIDRDQYTISASVVGLSGFEYGYSGLESAGDYFALIFANDFTAGQVLSASISVFWSVNVFDPTKITTIDAYWGAGDEVGPTDTGTFLGSAPVEVIPEPSTWALLGFGMALVIWQFRRRTA